MKEKFQLLLALLVAALFSDILDKTTWTRARAVFTVWFGKEGEKASEELYQDRIQNGCHQCPIFYKPLATCGSPFVKELRGLGCLCHTPSKARLKESTCWLRDNATDSEYGWRI